MIIAEIGQNHCGDMMLARHLIEEARDAGADLVKFQLYDTDALYEPNTLNYSLAREAELSFEEARDLFDTGHDLGIEVFFSVFDIDRVLWCEDIGVRRYKIAYSQRWNYDILKLINDTWKPIILSTDGTDSRQRDVTTKVDYLYCIPEYPATIKGLNCISMFSGYSDHTIGLDACKIAIAKGAEIIEKHFAIDTQTGVDARWSMIPDELRELKEWENKVRQSL